MSTKGTSITGHETTSPLQNGPLYDVTSLEDNIRIQDLTDPFPWILAQTDLLTSPGVVGPKAPGTNRLTGKIANKLVTGLDDLTEVPPAITLVFYTTLTILSVTFPSNL